MNIVLIGYRASGKTTVGRLLASRLNLAYQDVDQITMDRFNSDSIADIWQQHGEPAWRAAEVQVTRELCEQQQQIVSLGGGTLMQQGAREAVEQASDTFRVYLRCDVHELFRRTSSDHQSARTRPNLTNLGGGVEEIEAVLAKREPVYRAVADLEIDVTHLAPEQVADTISAKLPKKVSG